MRRRRLARAAAVAALLVAPGGPAHAQLAPVPEDRGATGLGLALRRAGTTARVLYVTAHPDDEHNGMLVRLSRGLGVRTALFSLTRGEGGQNEIGSELFEALGVLRTEELLAGRRLDGAEQMFGLAYEFGYSFSVEESLEKWGRDAALSDVVRALRTFRPDVVLILPLDAPGGGQHHQAAAQIARDAFRIAADPQRFPEHMAAGLRPWQALKLYEGGVGGGPATGEGLIRVTTATYDTLLGMSWQQYGSLARAGHRSQGVSQIVAPAGEGRATFRLLDGQPAAAGEETDVLDGIDTTLTGLLRFAPAHEIAVPGLAAALREAAARLAAARAAFDAHAPERVLAPLQQALGALRGCAALVRASALEAGAQGELSGRLGDEERDVEAALVHAHGMAVESLTSDDLVLPGQTFVVTTRITNHGATPILLDDVALRAPEGWTVREPPPAEGATGAPSAAPAEAGASGRALAPGASFVRRHEVTVAPDAPPTQPHWSKDPDTDRNVPRDPRLALLPWAPPALATHVAFRSGDATATTSAPTMWRYAGPAGGEKQKVLQVVPALTVDVEPAVVVVATGAPRPREVRVVVTGAQPSPAVAAVRLEVPEGWRADPARQEATVRFEGDEAAVRFTVIPPPRVAAGHHTVRALASLDGAEFQDGVQVIAYPHTQERRSYAPAAARALALDVAVAPGAAVGYVRGPGDLTAEALEQLGVPVTFLGPDDLAFGELGRFTTIVTGVRAFQTRADLKASWRRVMEFAEQGGHVVVQYNKFEFNQLHEAPRAGGFSGTQPLAADSPFAPYPASVTNQRITDEGAPPRLLAPESPLLTTPNRLGPQDWAGWVQERGLYFLDARDARYVDVLAFTDPFPKNPGEKRGALVETRVGRGTWTYVGLGLFRQLPAGVPGAYRLLANLVSRPRG